MPRVVGIDHLVLSVGDFMRSKAFYGKLLGFLGLQAEIRISGDGRLEQRQDAVLDRRGRPARQAAQVPQGRHRFPSLCLFELSSRRDVDQLGAFLEKNGMTVVDPPGEYYEPSYYAVYFTDPDGMKLEGMIWAPPRSRAKRKQAVSRKAAKKTKSGRKSKRAGKR